MIPRLANRTPPMRPMPGNTGEPGLENLAAAFALLTQRRALAIQHIRMLDQQRFAAVAGLVRLQKRIAWLMRRIDALSPDLRDPAGVISADPPRQEPQDEQPGREPTEHQMPQQPPRPAMQVIAAHSADALAAIGREWVAAQPSHPEHALRPRWARRF